ncbi:MAG: peptidase M16 [Candidatus Amoebophilus sp. 36-38]|nr:MAG: peptidase M16 [Candidatus Amoebophilus sp. 36-38]
MIKFESFTLENGLQVVVHEDPNSLLAAVNIMYHVGARDENPHQTGLAHLFEHLMFGGSKNILSYDHALQQVGGNNNAYTSSDVTSYHCILPAANLETAFWLESDRMLGLALNKQGLEVQKKVVIEEFKEVYLNQPYGDAWLLLTELAYTKHPYQWPVIGKEISHIEQVKLEDVQAFSNSFYAPNNAILVVAGAVELEQVKQWTQKWFAPIPARATLVKNLPQEPIQQAARKKAVKREVPLNAIYTSYHVPGRLSKEYYAVELLCTALGVGKSSRLYQGLIEDKSYFNSIGAYTTETIDPGLLVIAGRVNEEVSLEQAEKALLAVLKVGKDLTEDELDKARNHIEASLMYESVDLAHRAEELAFATLLGDTNLVNNTTRYLSEVSLKELHHISNHILKETNSSTLYYQRT